MSVIATNSFYSAVRNDPSPLSKTGGGYRSCAPGETVDRLVPRQREFGITRLANITGLDRIGIPVWIAVRPNSRSLSLSQGKGLTHEAARASALCESIETFYAERCVNPLRMVRYESLRAEGNVTDVERLPMARHGLYSHEESIPWVEGVDLIRGKGVWVPYELVHADATVPRHPGSGCFVFSTNGLASGNTAAEAAFHGLCELVERDAMALWKIRSAEDQKRTRVCNRSVSDPVCAGLIQQLDSAEIDALIWDVTSDVGVAAFRVLIYDRWAQSQLVSLPVAFGAGCHPERGIALTRALTEAAQSRLTAISGARDDFSRRAYTQAAMPAEVAAEYIRLAQEDGERRWERIPDQTFDCISQSLSWLLEQLDHQGIQQVCAVPVSPENAPLHVVRTLAVGLEGPSSSPSWTPGARASNARRIAA
ncbi:MAG TPA: YcaO-like family protein [Bryobacteraceae bacterium]|nr:YcaO-like family protein [Bryobacteraceae bacterium]